MQNTSPDSDDPLQTLRQREAALQIQIDQETDISAQASLWREIGAVYRQIIESLS